MPQNGAVSVDQRSSVGGSAGSQSCHFCSWLPSGRPCLLLCMGWVIRLHALFCTLAGSGRGDRWSGEVTTAKRISWHVSHLSRVWTARELNMAEYSIKYTSLSLDVRENTGVWQYLHYSLIYKWCTREAKRHTWKADEPLSALEPPTCRVLPISSGEDFHQQQH